jgi:DNA-directed RNA polymerase specialized sigma24 family protein
MTCAVPPEHVQIDADLEAWGRWSQRKRGGFHSACGSAEGAYQAPWRQWHYPTAEEMMPQPVAKDMLAIDRAVVRLPVLYLELVRLHYVARLAPRTIRRRLAIHVDAWESQMFRARQMVVNNMKRAEAREAA